MHSLNPLLLIQLIFFQLLRVLDSLQLKETLELSQVKGIPWHGQSCPLSFCIHTLAARASMRRVTRQFLGVAPGGPPYSFFSGGGNGCFPKKVPIVGKRLWGPA